MLECKECNNSTTAASSNVQHDPWVFATRGIKPSVGQVLPSWRMEVGPGGWRLVLDDGNTRFPLICFLSEINDKPHFSSKDYATLYFYAASTKSCCSPSLPHTLTLWSNCHRRNLDSVLTDCSSQCSCPRTCYWHQHRQVKLTSIRTAHSENHRLQD